MDPDDVRKMMLSNSIDARGQRSGTKIHEVAESDGEATAELREWLDTDNADKQTVGNVTEADWREWKWELRHPND